MRIFVYAAAALIMCSYFGFAIWKNGSKVKRLEKLCDKLRADKRLALNKAKDCDQLVLEQVVDTSAVFNKLKPLCYQIDMGAHTIFLCLNLNENSFYMMTLFGDAKLIPLNYEVVLEKSSNKIIVYAEKSTDPQAFTLQKGFAYRLLKYCGIS